MKKQKRWFRLFKKFMKIFIKKSEFIYLGDKIEKGGIILSNHEGTSAPLASELYGDFKVRFWGNSEMNSGLIKMYKYQTRIFYHEKKHWNLHLARLYCLLASPLTNIFYKGLNIISTYQDNRLIQTIHESIDTLIDGENIIIYPEKSDKGYLKELEGFHAGFVVLLKACIKKGIDAPVYIAYYKKEERKYIIDKPVYISKLLKENLSKEELSQKLCERCNELGKMEI